MSEKIEAFWVNATAFEVARVMNGETVEARFRDFEKDEWKIAVLSGWSKFNERDRLPWATRGGLCYMFCQVYREPSWWTERPDPGPGYRLLGKFPDEDLKSSDEFYREGVWNLTCKESGSPHAGYWYRRRIEPVEPKFAVGQTVKVVGPKQIPALEWSSVGMAQYAGTTQTIERVELLTNPPGTYYHLKGVVNWCFREDYLEPVEPVKAISMSDFEAICNGELVKGYAYKLPNGQTITITEKGFEVKQ
jgi:hypothetical protein